MRGRGGGYQSASSGKGKSAGKGRAPAGVGAESRAHVHIPEGAIGLVIGQGGSNIKRYQAKPGVVSVSMNARECVFTVMGSADAVQDIEMDVQSLLNKFATSATRPTQLQLHIDMVGIPVVRLALAASKKLPVHLHECKPRDYFVLTCDPSTGELGRAFQQLSIEDHGRTGLHHVHFPLKVDAMATLLDSFLANIQTLPRTAKVEVRARFGVTLFHSPSEAARRDCAPTTFSALETHKDYKLQFSGHLRATVETLRTALARRDFEIMEHSCNSVVHIVSTQQDGGYVVTFVEPDAGQEGDPRRSKEKRKELDRMRMCRSSVDVLQVSVGALPTEIKKAFRKKSLLVHPDKNACAGAGEAMKILISADEALRSGEALTLSPPLFEVGAETAELPQITSLKKAKQTHFQVGVIKADGRLGFRVFASSEEETENPAVCKVLERAWSKGEVVSGGKLKVDAGYSIEAVRFKDNWTFSDGQLEFQLSVVRQKSLEGGGQFATAPELEVFCPEFDVILEEIRAKPNARSRARALDLFKNLVFQANSIAGVLL